MNQPVAPQEPRFPAASREGLAAFAERCDPVGAPGIMAVLMVMNGGSGDLNGRAGG